MTLRGRLTVLLVSVALLAGCSAGAGSNSSTDLSFSEGASDGGAGAPARVEMDGAEAGGAGQSADDRQVITTGSVGIVVEDPAAAAQEASELVEAAGGRVDERVEQAASDERQARAQLVVRIPSEELTETLAEIKALGEVDQVQLRATDVTDEVKDLTARISAMQVSVARLEALMAAATTSSDLISLESALSSRQSELEAMQAQRTGLAGKVALATVTIELWPEGTVVAAAGPDGFWSGVLSGSATLVAAIGSFLILVGVLLPWLVFLGVVAALVLAAVRWARRRRAPVAVPATAVAGPGAGGGTTS